MGKRKIFMFLALLFLMCAAFFTACGDKETHGDDTNNPGVQEITVDSVFLDKSALTLEIGESYSLTATVLPADATNKDIEWTSTDTSVASVDSGNVIGLSEGTTTITASSNNGKTATCNVTVNKPAPEIIEVTDVSLNKTTLILELGESETLTTTVSPANATEKSVTWISSAPSIAAVSNGTVTAKAAGTATVTVKTSNGKTATCNVTIKAVPPEITSVEGATINGTDIFLLVDSLTDSVALLNKVTVSSGNWALYADILGQTEIPTKIAAGSSGKLENGENLFYIILKNNDGEVAQVYTLNVYRSYAVSVNYYNHKNTLIHTDTAYTGYEYEADFKYSVSGYTFHNWTENETVYQSRILWNNLEQYVTERSTRT